MAAPSPASGREGQVLGPEAEASAARDEELAARLQATTDPHHARPPACIPPRIPALHGCMPPLPNAQPPPCAAPGSHTRFVLAARGVLLSVARAAAGKTTAGGPVAQSIA